MSKKETAVATKGQFDLTNLSTDQVPAMMEMVAKQLKSLRGEGPQKVGTDKPLPGFGKRIKDFDKVEDLIMAYSAVENRAKCYNEVAEKLEVNVKKYPFKLEGFTAKQWMDDITLKLSEVKNKKDIEKLEKTQNILSSLLSEEDKKRKSLETIAKLLNEEEID